MSVSVVALAQTSRTGRVLAVVNEKSVVVTTSGGTQVVRLAGIERLANDRGLGAEYLRRLVQDRDVAVEIDSAGARIYRAPDSLFINREMVCAGYAAASNGSSELLQCEQTARQTRRGLWNENPDAAAWETRFPGVRYLGEANPAPLPKSSVAPQKTKKSSKAKRRPNKRR